SAKTGHVVPAAYRQPLDVFEGGFDVAREPGAIHLAGDALAGAKYAVHEVGRGHVVVLFGHENSLIAGKLVGTLGSIGGAGKNGYPGHFAVAHPVAPGWGFVWEGAQFATNAHGRVLPRSRAARSTTRSTNPVMNRSATPTVAERATSKPSPRAVPAASVSRSHTTSMWSETNPIGASTTFACPAAARSARWSLMSGSSHRVDGAPAREQYEREEVMFAPSARSSPSMTARTSSCCSR